MSSHAPIHFSSTTIESGQTRFESNAQLIDWLREYRATGCLVHRDRIFSSNAGKVMALAHRLWDSRVQVEDLYQEGVIGFLEGLDAFDFDKAEESGCSVSAYACLWSRKRMLQHLNRHKSPFSGTESVIAEAARAIKIAATTGLSPEDCIEASGALRVGAIELLQKSRVPDCYDNGDPIALIAPEPPELPSLPELPERYRDLLMASQGTPADRRKVSAKYGLNHKTLLSETEAARKYALNKMLLREF